MIHYNIPKWQNIELFFTDLAFLGYHVVFLLWSMFWSNFASQNYKKTTKIHYCNFNVDGNPMMYKKTSIKLFFFSIKNIEVQ